MLKTVARTLFHSSNQSARVLFATLALFMATGLTACVTSPPPYEEYTLAREAMKAKFGIDHVTIQIETDDLCIENANLPI